MSSFVKKFMVVGIVCGLVGIAGVAIYLISLAAGLPKIISLNDYHPKLTSIVYARGGQEIGEFYRENRILVPYDKIPKQLVNAFLAAEDDHFFQHGGVNFASMFRALIADIRAGHTVQGGSTITQQVAKTLFLTPRKTITRKLKEVLLAMRMERSLTKQDILYLYLNQIYLGQGAFGVDAAAQTYFHKSLDQLNVGEMAILAGLPQAPSHYDPITDPRASRIRQHYVLHRMFVDGFISKKEEEHALHDNLVVHLENKGADVAPYYIEALRQLLVKNLGEQKVLDGGLKIYTGLCYKCQREAQQAVRHGLREVDKRQGYRGPIGHLTTVQQLAKFLLKSRNQLEDKFSNTRVIRPDGTIVGRGPLNLSPKGPNGHRRPNVPPYVNLGETVKGYVVKVDDRLGLVIVRFAEGIGAIDIDTMKWAHKPNPNLYPGEGDITKPSQALKAGDIIDVKVVSNRFDSPRLDRILRSPWLRRKYAPLPNLAHYAGLELEQTPKVQAALLSIDQKTQDLIAMVGGYDFKLSQFNRALQAARQTGSAFKVFVYSAALDKGFTPSTKIVDSPVVFNETVKENQGGKQIEKVKQWKPVNDTKRFGGDTLFRTALIESKNVPTVKILNQIGLDWPQQYARRLGVFSPLNNDLSMGLGSSSITLFEMTRAFSELGRMGRRTQPVLLHKVVSSSGKVLESDISLDQRFQSELQPIEQKFEQERESYLKAPTPPPGEPPLFFSDPDQLMKPQTAYVLTNILKGVINEPDGTGFAAHVLGRPAAGKTGTASNYVDAWFLGYTEQIATGVWVGYDSEQSLGKGEEGAHAALPIWLQYMQAVHEGLPVMAFPVPPGVVFANIDRKTGYLASASSRSVVRQSYIAGTAPTVTDRQAKRRGETRDFLKEDISN